MRFVTFCAHNPVLFRFIFQNPLPLTDIFLTKKNFVDLVLNGVCVSICFLFFSGNQLNIKISFFAWMSSSLCWQLVLLPFLFHFTVFALHNYCIYYYNFFFVTKYFVNLVLP